MSNVICSSTRRNRSDFFDIRVLFRGCQTLQIRLQIHQLMSDDRQPATDNRQPTTTDDPQPATDNRRPTTHNRQPAHRNRQPTTDDRHDRRPTIGNPQPATDNPTTHNRQPATGNRQPVTDYMELWARPTTDNRQPATDNRQSTVINNDQNGYVRTYARFPRVHVRIYLYIYTYVRNLYVYIYIYKQNIYRKRERDCCLFAMFVYMHHNEAVAQRTRKVHFGSLDLYTACTSIYTLPSEVSLTAFNSHENCEGA